MKAFQLPLYLMFVLLTITGTSHAKDKEELLADANSAIKTFQEADSSISQEMKTAKGYAVFNSVGKGGIGIGGAHGKGVLFAGGSPVGSTSLSQVTIGFQLGGQVYSEIIFFESEQALNDFKNGNFALGAQVSAVAAAAGASADAPYTKGVKVITITKTGLMYEASVGGQKFSYKSF